MNIKLTSYNQKGEKKGAVDIKTAYSNLNINNDTLYQVINSYMSNARQVLSNTKTRAEVSGTGKKPYRQKGTGNARFGSLRTPIHIGGGIAFGPRKNRNFKKDINKKVKNKALISLLNLKNKENKVFCISSPKLSKPNTKEALKYLSNYSLNKGSILICLPKKNDVIYKSLRNIVNITIIPVNTINALYMLSYDNIVFIDDAYNFLQTKTK